MTTNKPDIFTIEHLMAWSKSWPAYETSERVVAVQLIKSAVIPGGYQVDAGNYLVRGKNGNYYEEDAAAFGRHYRQLPLPGRDYVVNYGRRIAPTRWAAQVCIADIFYDIPVKNPELHGNLKDAELLELGRKHHAARRGMDDAPDSEPVNEPPAIPGMAAVASLPPHLTRRIGDHYLTLVDKLALPPVPGTFPDPPYFRYQFLVDGVNFVTLQTNGNDDVAAGIALKVWEKQQQTPQARLVGSPAMLTPRQAVQDMLNAQGVSKEARERAERVMANPAKEKPFGVKLEQRELEHWAANWPRYRKKPVEVVAVQLLDSVGYYISTLEGDMFAAPGDYIIRGVKGEFYPCKADIFRQTYTAIDAGRRSDASGGPCPAPDGDTPASPAGS